MASSSHKLIHPRLLAALGPNIYPSRCRIVYDAGRGPDGEPIQLDSYGQPVEDWRTLPGHEAIPCRVVNAANIGRGRGEQRREDHTATVDSFQIALQGYYPAITELMQAVVGDVTYNITLPPESDGNSTYTSLRVEIVR